MNDDKLFDNIVMGFIAGCFATWLFLALFWMFLTPVKTFCGVLPRAYNNIESSVYEGEEECYIRYVGTENYILFEAGE